MYSDRFPRSNAYNTDWLLAGVSGGANPLWMAEWLAEAVELKSGMRVLDLGCGRALSSIFFHREFGVEVWATDLWFSPSENLERIRHAGVERGVIPIRADARALPYADDFFDAVVSIDSFPYYGTDDQYLNRLARLVKPGGELAIAGAGLSQEIDGPIPEHLRAWWEPGLSCLHSALWWRRHWERSGLVDVESADTLPDGWQLWSQWHRTIAPENAVEIEAVESDQGRYLGYVRAVAKRNAVASFDDPAPAIPPNHVPQPLLR